MCFPHLGMSVMSCSSRFQPCGCRKKAAVRSEPLKKRFKCRRLRSNEEVEIALREWSRTQEQIVCRDRLIKYVPRRGRCYNILGDNVEEWHLSAVNELLMTFRLIIMAQGTSLYSTLRYVCQLFLWHGERHSIAHYDTCASFSYGTGNVTL